MVQNNLEKLRKEHHKTQLQIANFLNLTQSGYGKYELGKRDIPTDIQIKLSKYYNISIDYLLGNEKTAEDKATTEKKQLYSDLLKAELTPEKYSKMTQQQQEDLLNIIKIFVNNRK